MSTEKQLAESAEQELEDIRNVDDAVGGEDESLSGELYSISSYGVDHNVEALVKRINSEQYYIPTFQRQYVWTQNDASRFIESLLLGLPVPGLFLYKEQDSAKHLVIDGQQRLKSLQRFYKGTFDKKKFQLTGLKSKWADLAYADLSEDDRLRLDDAIVHATIFKQDTPTDNMDSVYEVFERINTGGMKLSPQEIRTCVAHGNFNELLFKLNNNADWRSVFGTQSIRLKDVEMVLRFFAFYENLSSYQRPMKSFLTNYMSANKKIDDERAKRLSSVWADINRLIVQALGAKPFRPGGRALNAAMWDCFMVAAAKSFEGGVQLSDESVKSAYSSLLANNDFMKVISSSTADDENIKVRFRIAEEAFADAVTI
ncbi:GmrSD restriction endonuclease domain-containing protein [Agrobacterium tumefaciens]|uniref:GmrSD restriction endonuclease domain-containing protein n=1 Tax=Agrobacterium tumefaciens TaxID=358 RepID=UPI0004719ECE